MLTQIMTDVTQTQKVPVIQQFDLMNYGIANVSCISPEMDKP